MHAQIHNGLIDSNRILHIDSMGGLSDMFETISKLIRGFWRSGGAKFGLSR